MKNFEARLEKLEEISDMIRKSDIPLDEAIKSFEEGIKLARTLQKDLDSAESRIEILMNAPEDGPDNAQTGKDEKPILGLFEQNS
jgi:exodeoxyribonuclease VII small subunit